MAASAIIGLVSAGMTALSGGTLLGGFLLGAGAAGTFFTHFLISTAMGVALNALTPKPSLGATSRGYSIAGESGAALDHQIIYGEVRVGGVRVYDASTGTNNEFLHRIMAFAGHEVDSYQEIYLNDEVVTLDVNGNVTSPSRYNGFVRIKQYSGTTTQTADADLISETSALTDGRWTSAHRLQGIAYLYVRFKYNADAFPNGIPAVSATIRGKKVFDPRTSTTAWSDNPALCLRDYIASDYGLDQPSGSIEDNLVEDAADWCDDTVDSEVRYSCNGNFVTSFEPSQILSDMLTSMGGLLWYSQGKWRMKAAKYTTPTITLDENDLRSGISLSTRHSRRSNFNTVKGKFKGAESDWQEADYPVVSDPAFVSADNNLVNTLDFSLPFTTSSKTAQRIANIALRRNREQLTFSASFGLKAFQVDVGDFVYVNNTRFGWSNKAFEVTNWTFGLTEGLDLQVQMTLREISSAVFTDESASVFESNNTTLPSPFLVPSIGIALDSEVRIINEHITNAIYVDVTSSTPFAVERVEVQFKRSSDTDWSVVGVGDLGRFEILDVFDDFYDIRARAYSFLGVKGDWETYTNFVVAGLAFPPADVTGLSAQLNGATVNLNWNPVPDLDLSFYRIRHSVDESGADWAGAVTYVEKVPRPGASVAVPAKPGTYMIRAYDKTGNISENFTSVTVPAAALEAFTTTLTDTEDPTFPGTKTSCSVVGSNLEITTVSGTAPFTATYEFSGYIDTGSVRRFRSRVDVDITRVDRSAGLWDNLPGLFDALPGLFDDFTGGSQIDDTNVVTYIATTQDDPAGTPTWSAWQELKVGDFYARAAKYKIELSSQSVDITPSITSLDAIVQHN
jgi:Putative phage tail protein